MMLRLLLLAFFSFICISSISATDSDGDDKAKTTDDARLRRIEALRDMDDTLNVTLKDLDCNGVKNICPSVTPDTIPPNCVILISQHPPTEDDIKRDFEERKCICEISSLKDFISGVKGHRNIFPWIAKWEAFCDVSKETEKEKEKGNKNIIWIIVGVVGGIVLLTAIGLGIWFFYSRQ